MDIFKGQELLAFCERFKTDDDCRSYLAELVFSDSCKSKKCEYTKCQIRKNHTRTCNKCSHTQSATNNTLFHKVKFGLRKAFFICFEMATTTKGRSASYTGVQYGITENTAGLFMHKVREAMKPSGNNPIAGRVNVDEFVVGGKETGKQGISCTSKKKKAVCAVELTKDGKVKRFYALRIDDFSNKSLKTSFEKHINKDAKVTTDEWKGYRPTAKDYTIEQVPKSAWT